MFEALPINAAESRVRQQLLKESTIGSLGDFLKRTTGSGHLAGYKLLDTPSQS
jgi:hypothetical protein